MVKITKIKTTEDYENNNITKEEFNIIVESFKNFLNFQDKTNKLKKTDDKGNEWTYEKLEKLYKQALKSCREAFNDGVVTIDDKGNMSGIETTEKYIFTLMSRIEYMVLLKRELKEIGEKTRQ